MDAQNHFSPSSGMRSFLTACGIKAASLLKTSYIVGSYAAFFSASSIALPLVGAWSTIPTIITTCAFGFLVRLALGASFMPMLAYWIPGLCAALYWQLLQTFPHWFTAFVHDLICISSGWRSRCSLCILLVHSHGD